MLRVLIRRHLDTPEREPPPEQTSQLLQMSASHPPGESRALGCILPGSNAGCPKPHELGNGAPLFGPLHESHGSTVSVNVRGLLAS